MIQGTDLGDNRNLFVVSVILIAGVGGLTLAIGQITITKIACALILGILVNLVVSIGRNKKQDAQPEPTQEESQEAQPVEE